MDRVTDRAKDVDEIAFACVDYISMSQFIAMSSVNLVVRVTIHPLHLLQYSSLLTAVIQHHVYATSGEPTPFTSQSFGTTALTPCATFFLELLTTQSPHAPSSTDRQIHS
jgi:hypothetical protein